MPWRVDYGQQENHCIPVEDLIEHTNSQSCACRPFADSLGAKALYIHHAADGREHFESDFKAKFSVERPA